MFKYKLTIRNILGRVCTPHTVLSCSPYRLHSNLAGTGKRTNSHRQPSEGKRRPVSTLVSRKRRPRTPTP